jgi:hypothetical protein
MIGKVSEKECLESGCFQILLNKNEGRNKFEMSVKSLKCGGQLAEVPRSIQVTGMLESGKFKSMFLNATKIGQGAYGSVFRAIKNI